MISKNIIIKFVLFICCTVSSFAQIEAGKAVIITVSGIPTEEKGRIDGTYPVSDSGFINMPFIGPIHAANMRNDDLAVSLQSRYKSLGIYTNITIIIYNGYCKFIFKWCIIFNCNGCRSFSSKCIDCSY